MSGQLHLFKGRRQRGVRAPPALEFATQCAVADVLRRWAKPTWVWSHIGHGERRDAVTGARLKRMGLLPGLPDLMLLPPKDNPNPRCHWLELKRRGAQMSEHQAGFALWCSLNGYPHAVVHSVGEAVEILRKWGAVRAGIEVQ